jgi:predicted RecA/RadA family phage recombinase
MSYPRQTYPSGATAGREISPAPTQGGSKITLLESLVTAPTAVPALGEAAICGSLTGVVVTAAEAGGDLVLQSSGVFSLPVVASDDLTP